MAVFTWSPGGANKKVDPRVREATFGDGYSQRVGDGINTQLAEWSLTFTGKIEDIDAIEAFLEARGGHEAFDWTDPRGKAMKVVCKSWSPSPYPGLRSATLAATFKQVPA